MDKTLITVIVPIYNTKEYLKDCLNSIIFQSYHDFQIVLVDDGSTDGCGLVCDEYAEKDARIEVIHQTNKGLVNARKSGLKVAQGNYIYYVDSDDWLDNNVIEVFMAIIRKYDVDMVSVGIKREYGNNKVQIDPVPFEDGIYDNKEDISKILIPQLINTEKFFEWGQHLTYWHYLIKKELLLQNQKEIDDEIRMAEDIICVYPCILDSKCIYIYSKIYYHYRQRNNSMKWTELSNEYANLQKVYNILREKFWKSPERNILMKKLKYFILFEILTSVPDKMLFKNSTFPYIDFPPNSKVVIYGAGLFGNKVIDALHRNKYANVVAWVDKNFTRYREQGYEVVSPDILKIIDFDFVLLAVIRADIRENIMNSLREFNIPLSKLIDFDMDSINQTSLPKDFIDFSC